MEVTPHYPLPWFTIGRLAGAILAGRQIPFRPEALQCAARLRPPLQVFGQRHIPAAGPGLIVINHYSAPGFHAWWQVLSVSSQAPQEIHWVITAALTRAGFMGRRVWTPATRWVLNRIACAYEFSTMPPMPPQPEQAEDRARSVRSLLQFARQNPHSLIGLAPEGADAPGGVLQMPPPGAGRLMLHIAALGFPLIPVGIFEHENCLCLNFGAPFELCEARIKNRLERDRLASEIVMQKIAALLPAGLRGTFSCEKDLGLYPN